MLKHQWKATVLVAEPDVLIGVLGLARAAVILLQKSHQVRIARSVNDYRLRKHGRKGCLQLGTVLSKHKFEFVQQAVDVVFCIIRTDKMVNLEDRRGCDMPAKKLLLLDMADEFRHLSIPPGRSFTNEGRAGGGEIIHQTDALKTGVDVAQPSAAQACLEVLDQTRPLLVRNFRRRDDLLVRNNAVVEPTKDVRAGAV